MKKAFQTHIIQRVMDEGSINQFFETYNNARYTTGREKRICGERDREIYRKYRNGSLIQELSSEYSRSYWWILRGDTTCKR